MNKKEREVETTCRNFDCLNIRKCVVDIWGDSYRDRPCNKFSSYYQSQKERIRFEHIKKHGILSFGNYWEN